MRARLRWINRPASGSKAQAAGEPTRKPPQGVLDLPFDRLYLEEDVARAADERWRRVRPDAAAQHPDAVAERPSWALVRVRDGDAALVDFFLQGVSVRTGRRAAPPAASR